MARVGLVLGAGGLVGQAYQAGVLTALEEELGWDPRTADVLVGTSAGAATASLLRLGVSSPDLATWVANGPFSVQGEPLLTQLGEDARQFPALSVGTFIRPLRIPRPALVRRLVTRPWEVWPERAIATLLQPGRMDLCERVHRLDGLTDGSWPEGLLVCAARRDDGRRVVFGTDSHPPVDLADAVAASCAIPGFIAPVRIGGVEYFDGGVHSTTNADILSDARLDVVVIVAPMSAAHGWSPTADGLWRHLVHRRLEGELASVRRAGGRGAGVGGRGAGRGVEVVRIEPGPKALAAMGLNAMDDDRADRVVEAAFAETTVRVTAEPVSTRLAALSPPAPRARRSA